MRLGSRSTTLPAALGVAALLAGCSAGGSPAGAENDGPVQSAIPTALIVDGSGSMNTDDAPGPRIDAAKTAARAYIDALPDGTDFSLWTYGPGTSDSEADHDAGCRDTVNLIPSGDVDRGAAKRAIDGIEPRGWSPIAATMKQAGQTLPTDAEASLVVVTDGQDHCGRPTICEVAKELHRSHPLLRIDAVGFMIDDDELNCAATATGGLYVTADNTEQLTTRLAASRDARLSKTTLTGRSFQGIEVGASHADIAGAHDDFPALSDGTTTACTSGDCGSDTVTVVRWRDCDWHFAEDGILYLIDPGDSARTIDGFGVGDDADELATFYGDVIEEAKGTLDGDDVTVRWYRADADRGLAWRAVIDGKNKIRAIVLCKCLPGSVDATRGNPGSADRDRGAERPAGSGANGEGTEVIVFDVFADDGSVREPFQSLVTKSTEPVTPMTGRANCLTEKIPDTDLHNCGLQLTDFNFGACSVFGDRVFCPNVGASGEVSITEYPLGDMLEANDYMRTEWLRELPNAVVTVDGEHFMRDDEPGTDLRYRQKDGWNRSGNGGGLVAPTGVDPFDRGSAFWTAERVRDGRSKSGESVRIARVYYFG